MTQNINKIAESLLKLNTRITNLEEVVMVLFTDFIELSQRFNSIKAGVSEVREKQNLKLFYNAMNLKPPCGDRCPELITTKFDCNFDGNETKFNLYSPNYRQK